MRTKTFQIVCLLVFIIYLLVLTRLIIFKFPPDMIKTILKLWTVEAMIAHIQSANLFPFKTISQALFNPQLKVELPTLIYNIIAFVPLGFLIPCVKPAFNKVAMVLLVGFVVSATFEIVQASTVLGTGDIDDVILNMLGVVVGYLIFKLVAAIYQKLYQSPAEDYGIIQ